MGKLFRLNCITGYFKRLVKQRGLPRIRFHDLHRSAAQSGHFHEADSGVAGALTFSTTAGIYFPLDFNSKSESVDAITGTFAEEKPAEEQNSGMEFDSMPLF